MTELGILQVMESNLSAIESGMIDASTSQKISTGTSAANIASGTAKNLCSIGKEPEAMDYLAAAARSLSEVQPLLGEIQ